MTKRVSATRVGGCRRGFILPLVLLATLAITALAVAAFALAEAEHRATEWERSWVGAVAGADAGGDAAGGGAPAFRTLAALGAGYQLVAVGSPGASPGASPLLRHEVWWCLDPRTEAAGVWKPGDHPARLGPLDPGQILGLLGVQAVMEPGTEILLVPGGTPGDPVRLVVADRGRVVVLRSSEGGVLLVVAEGSLRLAGSGSVGGILLVGGLLDLPDGIRITGGVRAGSHSTPGATLAPGEGAGIDVDTGFANRIVALGMLPSCPMMVHAMGRLGYF